MPLTIVIDEVVLTFRVPKDLSDPKGNAVRRTLMSPSFMRALRSAVRSIINKQTDLMPVTVALSR